MTTPSTTTTSTPVDHIPSPDDVIPTYRIDVGLPPEERYVKLATDFSNKIRAVVPLFDDVLDCLPVPKPLHKLLKLASRLFLRKVYDKEQTEEIKSIARVAGVDLFLAIALNVFLDILLGCTSGAILVRPKPAPRGSGVPSDRLMHFRTLEWGMDSLRSLLVELEFVNSQSKEAERVIARSVTYAGFVGVLTGVRQNLSLSLNHRPYHDCGDMALWRHQLLVLLGFRESVSSVLRGVLFSDEEEDGPAAENDIATEKPKPLSRLVAKAQQLASRTTSPCYVTLCDGNEVAIVLKDVSDGKVKTSSYFMIQTNHDAIHGSCCGTDKDKVHASKPTREILGGDEWLAESDGRLKALQSRWDEHMLNQSKENSAERQLVNQNGTCLDSSERQFDDQLNVPGISERKLLKWIRTDPTSNCMTHFSCIMDPQTGEIRGLTRGSETLATKSSFSGN